MNLDARVFDLIAKIKRFEKDKIQQIQLHHRYQLVDQFQIQPGMRVLEIGCGQGDTTVVLADLVGERGHVTAIDIAAADYGAPYTLGQATSNIQSSAFADRISFHLETDFLEFPVTDQFDLVIFSHCSWYFQSQQLLLKYFKKAREISSRLAVAEWDIRSSDPKQIAHFQAVTLAALYSQFTENEGNIQSVFSYQQIKEVLLIAGFQQQKTAVVDAHYLQDGAWEVAFIDSIFPAFSYTPEKIAILSQSLYENMKSQPVVESLNSFVIVAS